MLLPLTLSISTVRNWGVARVVFHAKSENTNPLDLMHCDRRRAMIKSQTDQAFREYAMAFKCCTLDWTPTYYRQAAPHMLIKEYKYTHKLQDLPTKPTHSVGHAGTWHGAAAASSTYLLASAASTNPPPSRHGAEAFRISWRHLRRRAPSTANGG